MRTSGATATIVRAVGIVLEALAVRDGVAGTGMATRFLSENDVRVVTPEVWGEDP
jgi:hypothetical protein